MKVDVAGNGGFGDWSGCYKADESAWGTTPVACGGGTRRRYCTHQAYALESPQLAALLAEQLLGGLLQVVPGPR